jgi:hypothetical protein
MRMEVGSKMLRSGNILITHTTTHRQTETRQTDSHQIDVTELVEPEVVDGCGDSWEVVGLEPCITQTHSSTQTGQNPPV